MKGSADDKTLAERVRALADEWEPMRKVHGHLFAAELRKRLSESENEGKGHG